MKSRATRNIQIEKQTRRALSKAAGARSRSDAKPTATKKAKKAAKKGLAKMTVKKKLKAVGNVIGFCDCEGGGVLKAEMAFCRSGSARPL